MTAVTIEPPVTRLGPPTPASVDLARVRLRLRAEDDARFDERPSGLALHGALHRALEGVAPDVARAAHAAAAKPLAIGPLRRVDDGLPVGRLVRAGERVETIIALLDAPTMRAGLRMLARGPRLRLNWARFALEDVEPVATAGCPSGVSSYRALLGAAAPDQTITLVFRSPTLFRSGDVPILEVGGERVFGSYLRRWRALSTEPLALADERVLAGCVQLRESQIVPCQVALRHPGDTTPALMGWARYDVTGEATVRAQVAALATYGAWCGTGARTAWGLGETERAR